MDDYKDCCGPDLKGAHHKRGSTDDTPVSSGYDKKTNAAIEARCGKPTSDLPAAVKSSSNPWDR